MARHQTKFKSVDDVKKIIDNYLAKYPLIRTAKTESEKLKAVENATLGLLPTLTGASLELGLLGIEEFIYYSKKSKYKLVFQEVRSRLQEYYEQGLATGKGSQGVSMWLDRVGKGFEQNQPLNANNQPLLNIVVVGSDGSKSPLQNLISNINAPRLESPKPLEIPYVVASQDKAPKPTKASKKAKAKAKTPKKP